MGDATWTSNRRRVARFVGLLLIGIIPLAGLACIGSSFLSGLPTRQCDDTASIESLAFVGLPPGAANIRAECGGFTDWFIVLTFDMPPEDLDAFMAFIPTPVSTTEIPIPFRIDSLMREWGLDWSQITSFVAGEASDNGMYKYVLVDMSNPARYVVWVSTFTT